ncbi:predicted protein [Botrytis cinerea T4]|uniref:Uncharacterized protein n=1 Tax=Botryotinia fuckeliana (strain T4) TaxID=999810 RepID=G2YGX4_BOTF4|nr:predicted protein [Botrytis cinerea T4]
MTAAEFIEVSSSSTKATSLRFHHAMKSRWLLELKL